MRAPPFRLLLLSLLLTSCGRSGTVEVLRLGHGLDVNHPVHRALVHFAERAEELSSGSLRIDVYPAEQLGSERELLELLQIGSVDITKVSAAVLEGFAPSYQLFGLPYLFDDREHQRRVLEGEVGEQLLLAPTRYRLRGLAFLDAGARSFYTRDRPVLEPSDLEGLKIRTQESATSMRTVGALGGNPTPIAWGELYTALQQGVVDGAENNPPSFFLSGHYEVCRHYSLDEHTLVPDVLLIATRAWEALDAESRSWLTAAAAEAATYQRQLWRESEQEALNAVIAAGVEVHRPDKAAFRDQVADLIDEYSRRPQLTQLISDIRAQSRSGTGAGSGSLR